MLLEWVVYYSMVTLTKGSKAMARPVQKLADFASSLIILTLILEAAGVSVGDAVADLGNQVLGYAQWRLFMFTLVTFSYVVKRIMSGLRRGVSRIKIHFGSDYPTLVEQALEVAFATVVAIIFTLTIFKILYASDDSIQWFNGQLSSMSGFTDKIVGHFNFPAADGAEFSSPGGGGSGDPPTLRQAGIALPTPRATAQITPGLGTNRNLGREAAPNTLAIDPAAMLVALMKIFTSGFKKYSGVGRDAKQAFRDFVF